MDSFWGNIFRREDRQEETYILLKNIPIFDALGKRELIAVEKILYRRDYAAGETIFRQEDPGVGMYIIERGTVVIVYEPTGRVLSELRDGDFFGEVALLNETPRSATAQARSACSLLCIFQPDMLDLVERNPQLGVKLLLALAQITGRRLIRLSDEAQALRQELAWVRAQQEGGDVKAPHERNHTAPGLEPDLDLRPARRGYGPPKDPLD
jgi:CRP/FNR family cyclic AMP-dependent transcriptional regulator